MNSDSTVRRFVKAAPMPICMYDKDMRILMASDSWIEERGGVPEEELLGRSMYDVLPWIPEKWRAIHRQILRGEAMRHERDVFDTPDGRQGWLKWSAAPWRGQCSRDRPAVR